MAGIKERIRDLQRIRAELPGELEAAMKAATIAAVENATENTPTNKLMGANTQSGEMKQSWATSSVTTPKVSGDTLTTVLANDKEYASYVDQGHRMDKHFVPGLNIGAAGLEYDPAGRGGIVVGTKTQYVPGLYITDKAHEEWRRVIRGELKRIRGKLEK